MPTCAEYIRALALDIEGAVPVSSTSAGTTTTVVSTAFSQVSQATAFDKSWLYWLDGALAGEQARCGSLNTSTTTLTTTPAFTGTSPSGASFLILGTLPAVATVRSRGGYREVINRALQRLWIVDYLPLSGVSDQQTYTLDLTTYPWFTESWRVLEVYAPQTDADDAPTPVSADWAWKYDGEAPAIVFDRAPFATGETFSVKVLRPANSKLKQSGIWTNQSSQIAGLSAAADEAVSDVNDVRIMAKALLYQDLSQSAPGEEAKAWADKAFYWGKVAAGLKNFGAPRDELEGIPRLNPVAGTNLWRRRLYGSRF